MRVQDQSAREWYLREAASQQWSVRQLERNIESGYYQRILTSGDMASVVHQEDNSFSVRQFIKDPYVLNQLN